MYMISVIYSHEPKGIVNTKRNHMNNFVFTPCFAISLELGKLALEKSTGGHQSLLHLRKERSEKRKKIKIKLICNMMQ